MKRLKKRTFLWFLILLLVLVSIPVNVFAEADDVEVDVNRVPEEEGVIPVEEEADGISIQTYTANPELTIATSVDKAEAWPGETVRYTFVVTNSGDVKMYDVDVDDSIEPGGPSNTPDINVGDSKTYTRDYTIPNGSRGIITNDAWADGRYGHWSWLIWRWDGWIASNHDAVDVTVKWPAIDLEKTVSKTEVFYGETIEYTLTVENTGTVPLYDVYLEDKALDFEFTWPVIAAGATEIKTISYTIPCVVPSIDPSVIVEKVDEETFTNCATVTGYLEAKEPIEDISINCIRPEEPPSEVTDTDCVTVNLNEESLGLTLNKRVYDEEPIMPTLISGPMPIPVEECLLIDNTQKFVYYYYDLHNTGDAPLKNIIINDNKLANPIVVNTFMDESIILQPGGSITIGPVPFDVGEVTVWPLINTATALGHGYCHETTSNEASACVNLASIDLDKTVSPLTALVGDIVSYTLKITNVGSVDLYNLELTDNKIAYSTIIPELKAGFTTTVIVPYTVKSEDVGEFVNTATVTANTCSCVLVPVDQTPVDQVTPCFPCMEVSDTDDAVLTVTTPEIPPVNPPEREEREPRQVIVVPPVEVPLAAPATEAPTEPEEVVPEEVVPLAPVVLPKTGELPATLFYSLGALISGLGVFLKRR